MASYQHTLVDRARNLFEFLKSTQRLKVSSPLNIEAYTRDGSVLWFADLPAHPAVAAAHRGDEPKPDDPLLTIDRVPRSAPPDPGASLLRWLGGATDDPANQPTLREAIVVPSIAGNDGSGTTDDVVATQTLRIADHPEISQAYDRWAAEWRAWAESERQDARVREIYNEVFTAYVKESGSPEELELVLGLGCLSWLPSEGRRVKRHLLTFAATIEFDDNTGRLTVRRSDSQVLPRIELDMLEPRQIRAHELVNDVRGASQEFEDHPLHRDAVATLVRRLVHVIDADGAYHDDEQPGVEGTSAVATFAPALILRKRSQQGLVEIFDTIIDQIGQSDVVPEGIIPLIDADHVPQSVPSPTEGARVSVDGEDFLPIPVNEKQRHIIEKVDQSSQVLVQGPPGTGKTHTAAALISHLLAQGKRVLVTAQTDRALHEVRAKLPDDIKPLAVSVVGSSREEMADLKIAVQQIANAAHDYDPSDNARIIQGCLDTIDRLRQQRAETHNELVAVREREVREYEQAGYQGTLASIARTLEDQASDHAWLAQLVAVGPDDPAPLKSSEILTWHGYLCDQRLTADEREAHQKLIDLSQVPSPEDFAERVKQERRAASAWEEFVELRAHPAFDAIRHSDPQHRIELRRRLHDLADEADSLANRRETWMNDALIDVRSGRANVWKTRGRKITELIEQCEPLVDQLGAVTEVELPYDEAGRLETLATNLRSHLQDKGKIKTLPDGTPKIGTLTSKPIKHSKDLFDKARVNGLPPVTVEHLDAVITWIQACRLLVALDRCWPDGVDLPSAGVLHGRLQWHKTEAEQLQRVLELVLQL